jgi:MFS family permease
MLPLSILMFLLARRFGALADRFGPRLFMGLGPIVCALGLLLLLRVGRHPNYLADILPGVFLLGLGLSVTVAPLTATVLSAAPAGHSGLASGVNNAVSRVAGLIAIAAVGAALAAHFSSQVTGALEPPAVGGARIEQISGRTVARAAGAVLEIRVPSGVAKAQRPQVRAALVSASTDSFHLAMLIAAAVALGAGALSLAGIRNGVNPD